MMGLLKGRLEMRYQLIDHVSRALMWHLQKEEWRSTWIAGLRRAKWRKIVSVVRNLVVQIQCQGSLKPGGVDFPR